MLEEEKMRQQENIKDVDVITAYASIPYSVIADDMSEASKSDYYSEVNKIIEYYVAYKKGQDFVTEGSNGNYIPSMLRYKKASSIINKEARFLFANPPTFNVNIDDMDDAAKEANSVIQNFLDKVLEKNQFNDKLLKAAKDCFIGKRVALVLNFNDSGITITFLNSLEFVCETTGSGTNELSKIVSFYNLVDTYHKQEQRWFKKTYELENGIVYVEETIYDGLGVVIEEVTPRRATKFTYIPAVVIVNDGLTGEMKGESELGYLLAYEGTYSKLANADIDAGRKSMNPTRYTIDASSLSTENLSTSPGSYWDLQSDDNKPDSRQAQVGLLEPGMNYSSALKVTLDRLENAMYSEVDVPNINGEQLQGIITSGKTLKALYWGLSVRCDEKMLAWGAALHFMAEAIIEGGKLYPNSIGKYTTEVVLPNIECDILVENNYPLPEDEEEEKNMDLAEINAQVMSRKAYLKKWRKLSDKEADEELEQIKYEQDLFENSELVPETEESDSDFEETSDMVEEPLSEEESSFDEELLEEEEAVV